MREIHAEQYGTSCVVIEDGDTADDVIKYADEIGARYYDGEDNMVVVDIGRGVGAEVYTESALRRSMHPQPGRGRMGPRWPIVSTTNPRRFLG